MQLADAIWTAAALLHRENPKAEDFEVQEIVSRAVQENFAGGFRPGLQPHASWHCVANKKPNGGRYRMLYETVRGRRRLVRSIDTTHPDRNGRVRPEREELPSSLRPLIDWYDNVYSRQPANCPTSVAVPHRFPPDPDADNASFAGFGEMRSETAYVGPGGTVVLPEYLQAELGLKEGACLSIYREKDRIVLLPITEDFIRSLRGSLKGKYSLLADREREHRIEKRR